MAHVLVTGSHRSGSTWVGRVLAEASGRHYLHEPFNLGAPEWLVDHPRTIWFERLSIDDPWLEEYERMLNSGLQFSFPLRLIRRPKKVARFLYDYTLSLEANYRVRSRLVKDPIALLSADLLYRKFDLKVVCLIRHPAAFVRSLLKAGWRFPFDHFRDQSELMQLLPSKLRLIVEKFSLREPTALEEAAQVWNILHFWISSLESEFKDWRFVKHEVLSVSPLDGFDDLLNYCGGGNNARLREIIMKSSGMKESEAKKPNDIKINSAANVRLWKEKLSRDEVERIKDLTSDYWPNWYSNEEW